MHKMVVKSIIVSHSVLFFHPFQALNELSPLTLRMSVTNNESANFSSANINNCVALYDNAHRVLKFHLFKV